ncbi:MAG: L,D-transpeptidase family protein [Verrucomicrobiales bacterium]|jgi:L,D-peptidoglycan transpeptidase YkuD (ErfK/YbiS/YcfS/YnhG family)|nr:L,D-transpeptidase family protein [Verrucomicrobiales bacterium]
MKKTGAFLLFCFLAIGVRAFTLPPGSQQLVLGIADDWQSSRITLQCFEKQNDNRWLTVSGSIPARGGRDGLVWGRGLNPLTANSIVKKEGDWKTPCGVFAIGGAYGYAASVRKHANLPYHQIVPGDLWVSDTSSPQYNQFVALGHPAVSAWEKHEQMRLNDPSHSLKLFIAHNATPGIVPGDGSAIFFHIWRANGEKPTAGCTAMAQDDLAKLIAWIDPAKKPLYVLLPKDVYLKVKAAWQLP